jgi:opacity protein-like surface antigen
MRLSVHRFTRCAALATATAALMAPAAFADTTARVPMGPAPNEQGISDQGTGQGLVQDLRSPDARDAGTAAAVRSARVDLRSPDARDAARGVSTGTVSAPTVEVVSDNGFDWSSAAIGAGAILGLILVLGGGALLVSTRRRQHPGAG